MSAKRKILIVDDERMLRELFKMILEQAGYEVILASDGSSGVAKSRYERPDLVILDGLMPKMHGFLACGEIKKQEKAPKVIVLTGVYTSAKYKLEAKYQHHADEFLTKPIAPADLLACVEKLLAGLPQRSRELPSQLASTGLELREAEFEVPAQTRPAQSSGYSANWKSFLKGEPISTSR